MILSFQLLVLLLWGPPSFSAELDVDILQYHVIPDRGVVLERFGTIFAHPQLKSMTAVITLDKLELTTDCNSELQSMLDDFNKALFEDRYKGKTYEHSNGNSWLLQPLADFPNILNSTPSQHPSTGPWWYHPLHTQR